MLTKLLSYPKRLGLDYFLALLLLCIGLAYLTPGLGAEDGPLPLSEITTVGVSFIFFFYGLRLSPDSLWLGLKEWRLHVVVQLSTFLLFPAIVFLASQFWPTGSGSLLVLGFFYVAALPSTVSSSVVMVSIAGGNIPAAIFNASISSLIGVFVTPLWMGLFLDSSAAADLNLADVMLNLIIQVVVPVVLGLALHNRFGKWAEVYKARLRYLDQAVILMIVYSSFSESFARDIFAEYTFWHLFLLVTFLVGLFFLVFGIILVISKALGFSRENQITAIFCGSKKSLVHGTVMSKVLFPDANVVGIILLPLMLYHALQLIIASMLAQKMARADAKLTNQ